MKAVAVVEEWSDAALPGSSPTVGDVTRKDEEREEEEEEEGAAVATGRKDEVVVESPPRVDDSLRSSPNIGGGRERIVAEDGLTEEGLSNRALPPP